MAQVLVREEAYLPLIDFLEERGFIVEQVGADLVKVHRLGGEEIFIVIEEESLYLQQQLGTIDHLASENFYRALLVLNSEIVPISAAIDNSGEKPKLILVARQLRNHLDSDELLGILDAMDLAESRVEGVLRRQMED